jgi:hypothetical protein
MLSPTKIHSLIKSKMRYLSLSCVLCLLLQALGKRLGPAMKTVCSEVRAMSSEAVLSMQVSVEY